VCFVHVDLRARVGQHSTRWLHIKESHGAPQINKVYTSCAQGKIPPDEGHVVSLLDNPTPLAASAAASVSNAASTFVGASLADSAADSVGVTGGDDGDCQQARWGVAGGNKWQDDSNSPDARRARL
jgi:hypothetical protein